MIIWFRVVNIKWFLSSTIVVILASIKISNYQNAITFVFSVLFLELQSLMKDMKKKKWKSFLLLSFFFCIVFPIYFFHFKFRKFLFKLFYCVNFYHFILRFFSSFFFFFLYVTDLHRLIVSDFNKLTLHLTTTDNNQKNLFSISILLLLFLLILKLILTLILISILISTWILILSLSIPFVFSFISLN